MRSISRALSVVSFAVTMTAAGLAFGDTQTAERLFQQGIDAMKVNQFKEACDFFAGSNEADPSPGTQINLALCNEKQDKLASAWGWYRTAAGLADQRGQKDRAELARKEAAKLEPKLHKLVISAKSPPEGLTVTRNGGPVPNAVLGTDIPIDPGDYVIEANAKNKKAWKQSVHVASAPGIDRVEIPALEDAPVEVAKPGTPGSADYVPPVGSSPSTTQRNIGIVVGGLGIVAGGIAVAVEFLALSENDKYKTLNATAQDTTKSQAERDAAANSATTHKDAAKSDQLIAIVTGAGAVVAIGVGITLILTAPSSTKSADLYKTRVFPMMGSGTGGFGLTGTF